MGEVPGHVCDAPHAGGSVPDTRVRPSALPVRHSGHSHQLAAQRLPATACSGAPRSTVHYAARCLPAGPPGPGDSVIATSLGVPVSTTLLQSDLPGLPLRHRGKVRDVFDIPRDRLPADAPPGDYLLMVATDRLSAFDVVLPDPIPGKGEMLCQVSNFWFHKTEHLMPNHLVDIRVEQVLPEGVDPALYAKRAVVTRKLKPVPVEAIARGYLIGSGWKDYQRTGKISGIELPDGLRQAEKLPEPIFTPSTKAAVGDHDENIDFDAMVKTVGAELAERVRDATLRIYRFAADFAAERGILLADTKFEFGTDADGRLYIMDEMLTPDSSRYWPADQYELGTSPPSYDKQFVRDYLETLDWGKTAPGPSLPAEVIARTRAKYAEALQRLAGISVD